MGPVHVVECLEGVLRVPPVLRVVHAQEVTQEQRLLRPRHFLKGLGHEIEFEYFQQKLLNKVHKIKDLFLRMMVDGV